MKKRTERRLIDPEDVAELHRKVTPDEPLYAQRRDQGWSHRAAVLTPRNREEPVELD